MYSLTFNKVEKNENGDQIRTEDEKRVAKGISKCEIKRTLKHEMYKNCVFKETITMNSMTCIRSHNHELFMDEIVKKGLCSFDDKRYWENAINSYAFGHYKIKEHNNLD